MSRSILVTGATGKQGKAIINRLCNSQLQFFNIIALTRNPDSPAANQLREKYPSLQFVRGDLDDCDAIFSACPTPIWGVFSVQATLVSALDPAREVHQGKALIDASLENGVRHFIYSSVDRHGANSDMDQTPVPHFQSKACIEKYLEGEVTRQGGNGSRMAYTIFRLPIFMENLSMDWLGKFSATVWKVGIAPDRSVQLISTRDIAYFVEQVILHPPSYNNLALSIAGDELTFVEANHIFRSHFDKDLPVTFGFLGHLVLSMTREIRIMMNWFNDVGCAANVQALRKAHPTLLTFREWLEVSDFANMG